MHRVGIDPPDVSFPDFRDGAPIGGVNGYQVSRVRLQVQHAVSQRQPLQAHTIGFGGPQRSARLRVQRHDLPGLGGEEERAIGGNGRGAEE